MQLIIIANILHGKGILSLDTFLEVIQISNNRLAWINQNVPAIEYWMRYNVLKVQPTYPPQMELGTEPSE